MPINWNDEADAKILVGIIKTAKPKIDYDLLAKYVGDGCTAYAVQHRIRKIQAKASVGENAASPPGTPAKESGASTKTTTPGKKTPRSGVKQGGSRGGKRNKAAMGANDTDTNADDEKSPVKKVKAEPRVKAENHDDEYDEQDDYA